MHRIDNASAVATKPAPPGSHTPGFFDPGDPVAERDATILDYYWANTVQEELAAIVEQGAGVALDTGNDNQVLAAIRDLIASIPHGVQVFSAVTTSNFVVPASVTLIDVELWGGGAGSYASYGAQRSGGGGAGAYARRRLAVTPGQSIAVTIGGGGAAALSSGVSWPGNGGTSGFGSYLTATGGRINSLSNPTSVGNGGEGGSASGGDLNIQGSSGSGATIYWPGMGGASGIGGTIGSGTTGVDGIAPGGGAAGAGFLSDGVTTCVGAKGAQGYCIVRW